MNACHIFLLGCHRFSILGSTQEIQPNFELPGHPCHGRSAIVQTVAEQAVQNYHSASTTTGGQANLLSGKGIAMV